MIFKCRLCKKDFEASAYKPYCDPHAIAYENFKRAKSKCDVRVGDNVKNIPGDGVRNIAGDIVNKIDGAKNISSDGIEKSPGGNVEKIPCDGVKKTPGDVDKARDGFNDISGQSSLPTSGPKNIFPKTLANVLEYRDGASTNGENNGISSSLSAEGNVYQTPQIIHQSITVSNEDFEVQDESLGNITYEDSTVDDLGDKDQNEESSVDDDIGSDIYVDSAAKDIDREDEGQDSSVQDINREDTYQYINIDDAEGKGRFADSASIDICGTDESNDRTVKVQPEVPRRPPTRYFSKAGPSSFSRCRPNFSAELCPPEATAGPTRDSPSSSQTHDGEGVNLGRMSGTFLSDESKRKDITVDNESLMVKESLLRDNVKNSIQSSILPENDGQNSPPRTMTKSTATVPLASETTASTSMNETATLERVATTLGKTENSTKTWDPASTNSEATTYYTTSRKERKRCLSSDSVILISEPRRRSKYSSGDDVTSVNEPERGLPNGSSSKTSSLTSPKDASLTSREAISLTTPNVVENQSIRAVKCGGPVFPSTAGTGIRVADLEIDDDEEESDEPDSMKEVRNLLSQDDAGTKGVLCPVSFNYYYGSDDDLNNDDDVAEEEDEDELRERVLSGGKVLNSLGLKPIVFRDDEAFDDSDHNYASSCHRPTFQTVKGRHRPMMKPEETEKTSRFMEEEEEKVDLSQLLMVHILSKMAAYPFR